MRENTRCEVEEPISTPTLRTAISSSSTSERPVEEKKMRPPSASFSVMTRERFVPPSRAHEFRHHGALLVEVGLHPARHALGLELGLVFGADEGVLHPVRDRGAALRYVHRGVVGVLLARRPGLAAGIVRPEPGGQSQRLLGGAEMLVVPARSAGRRRHHADRLVVDALDLVGMAVLPGRDALALRPRLAPALSPPPAPPP